MDILKKRLFKYELFCETYSSSISSTLHIRIRSAVMRTDMGKISVSLVFLCLAVSVLLISTDQEVQAAAPLPRYGRREEVSYIAVS